MKIAITCGGTGGHFYPGLAIARELQSDDVVLLLSGIHSREQGEIAAKANVKSVLLPEMPSPSGVRKGLRFLRGLVLGYVKARRALKEFRPDAVLGMGSFASLPVTLAAKACGIPVFLHDGNARIGRANRFLSRWATALGVAFPPVNGETSRCETIVCGMPVRPELEANAAMTKDEAFAKLNEIFNVSFTKDRPLLLVFGGSQGALAINESVPTALRLAGRDDIQGADLTGAGKMEAVSAAYAGLANPAVIRERSQDMDVLMRAASLAVSRSGGSTVAELAVFGLPAILIPYPYAAEGHQRDNANYFTNAGGGMTVDQDDVSPEKMAELISGLLCDSERLAKCAASALAAAKPRAGRRFLEEISNRI
ncbi:MAG: undecaprenyldiphospho-muramoylpentapeptide beta-N-acetylglucosaminyltransferase [Victivallaceae bacterium]|nr:undecaprenyldiphospho-muramoylpentapeptide beta-N-acetylglucosaminyltransferase [Victivallaceae bacterium]